MSRETIFSSHLRESTWFWLNIIGVVTVAATSLELLFRCQVRAVHVLSIAIAVVGVSVSMTASLQSYNKIRSLDIDWSKLDPGCQLAQVLNVATIHIKYVPFTCSVIAMAVMRLVHP